MQIKYITIKFCILRVCIYYASAYFKNNNMVFIYIYLVNQNDFNYQMGAVYNKTKLKSADFL
jgi:hypothetical protein